MSDEKSPSELRVEVSCYGIIGACPITSINFVRLFPRKTFTDDFVLNVRKFLQENISFINNYVEYER